MQPLWVIFRGGLDILVDFGMAKFDSPLYFLGVLCFGGRFVKDLPWFVDTRARLSTFICTRPSLRRAWIPLGVEISPLFVFIRLTLETTGRPGAFSSGGN